MYRYEEERKQRLAEEQADRKMACVHNAQIIHSDLLKRLQQMVDRRPNAEIVFSQTNTATWSLSYLELGKEENTCSKYAETEDIYGLSSIRRYESRYLYRVWRGKRISRNKLAEVGEGHFKFEFNKPSDIITKDSIMVIDEAKIPSTALLNACFIIKNQH